MRTGSSLRAAPQAELVAALNPVVLQGGKDLVDPMFHEVVLQQTRTWLHRRAVWSSTGGMQLHLYSDAEGSWLLSDKLDSPASDSIAQCKAGSLVPPHCSDLWQLAKSMCNPSDNASEWSKGKLLTLLCGDEGRARVVRGPARHTCMSACYNVRWSRRSK